MFLSFEPPDAASFTDETTGQSRDKERGKVSIHGQVGRFDPLDWFNEIRSLYPDVRGELKSKRVADNYTKLPWTLRQRINPGLRRVRIHVVDTFAYEAESKQIIRDIYKQQTGYELAVKRAKENDEYAKFLLKRMEDFVTESIILDSPAQRLEFSIQANRYSGFGFGSFDLPGFRRKELATDLEPFRKKKKSSIGVAASWVSRSASIFADAVDFADRRTWGEYEMRQQVGEMLQRAHAFDEGDEAAIEWMEDQREYFTSFNNSVMYLGPSPLYGRIDSRLSPRIQAADIAAGIAERIYDKHRIVGLVERFDYVTFNGERLTEENFSAKVQYWNQIAERERKIQAKLGNL